MRTSRLTGATALLVTLAVALPAAAQPGDCPRPEGGPPLACVAPDDAGPATRLPPSEPAEADPRPALWVGAIFGISGLAGIALATGGVRGRKEDDRRP